MLQLKIKLATVPFNKMEQNGEGTLPKLFLFATLM